MKPISALMDKLLNKVQGRGLMRLLNHNCQRNEPSENDSLVPVIAFLMAFEILMSTLTQLSHSYRHLILT